MNKLTDYYKSRFVQSNVKQEMLCDEALRWLKDGDFDRASQKYAEARDEEKKMLALRLKEYTDMTGRNKF